MLLAKQRKLADIDQILAESKKVRPWLEYLLGGGVILTFMLATVMIFFYAPVDAVQGIVQKVFYLHVPAAWLGMLAFVIVALGGLMYLWRKGEAWDWLARAAAESGTIFLSLALITGSIWAKQAWNTWWTWDPRLTLTLLLWFLFIAYLMVRSAMGRTQASARVGAVIALLGVIDLPIIYFSVVWWRTLHPVPQVGVKEALPTSVVLTLVVSLVAFTLLYLWVLLVTYRLQRVQAGVQQMRNRLEE